MQQMKYSPYRLPVVVDKDCEEYGNSNARHDPDLNYHWQDNSACHHLDEESNDATHEIGWKGNRKRRYLDKRCKLSYISRTTEYETPRLENGHNVRFARHSTVVQYSLILGHQKSLESERASSAEQANE